jgi:hypothetical protein
MTVEDEEVWKCEGFVEAGGAGPPSRTAAPRGAFQSSVARLSFSSFLPFFILKTFSDACRRTFSSREMSLA